jgi:sensor histidine kinase regulating citrate/malate metabolism
MSQAETQTLIAHLQRANRRWKMIALGLLSLLMILLLIASLLVSFAWIGMSVERNRAEAAMQEAMAQRELSEQQAVRARLEAEEARNAEQKARRDPGR